MRNGNFLKSVKCSPVGKGEKKEWKMWKLWVIHKDFF